MNKELISNIHKLRAENKSYGEIEILLGVSRGTISYHCSHTSREKHKKRTNKYRKGVSPILSKIYRFVRYREIGRKNKSMENKLEKVVYRKLYQFLCTRQYKRKHGRKFLMADSPIKVEEVLAKFGKTPKCYLTGEPIDISKPSEYSLDHIIPVSRGGESTLENMGLLTTQANMAKSNMTDIEFINFCRKVVEFNKNQ